MVRIAQRIGNNGQTVGVFRNLDVQKKLMLQDRNNGIGKFVVYGNEDM